MKLTTALLLIWVAFALLFSAVRHYAAGPDWNPPIRKATCCETTD